MRAAVLGSPIAHSLSPGLHRAAYQALGLVGWQYDARQIDVTGLAAFVAGLDGTWAGLSLTMPLKQAVIDLLDVADDLVAITGSCNTLVLPQRRGHNTDVDGILSALAEYGVAAAEAPLVLGGGATAASAAAAVAGLGAAVVTIAVRDPTRAAPVVRTCRALGLAFDLRPLSEVTFDGTDVVISTLPPGVADPLAARLAPVTATLLDVVYDPWPTGLAAAWQRNGGKVIPGDIMLLHQAARQVTLMTGLYAPLEAMRSGLAAERLRRAGDAGVLRLS